MVVARIALAWLLRRAPNILLISGTSSIAHLRENLTAAEIGLPNHAVKEMDRVAGTFGSCQQVLLQANSFRCQMVTCANWA